MARILPVLSHDRSESDVKNAREKSDMFHDTFKPVINTLKLFGLYFDIDKRGFWRSKWTFNRMYCVWIQIVVWLGFVRSLYPYRDPAEFGAMLFMKFIMTTWVSGTLEAEVSSYVVLQLL